MLTFIVYVIDRIRRFLKRTARGMRLVAEGFADAQEMRRAAERKYPFSAE
jgi:hypothetical protein